MGRPEDPSLSTTHDLSLVAREQRGRIWIDGCFDFAHHGHAGAMLQARQLGTALCVGVHSDEEITVNKGPPVMALDERIAAVDACRWATRSVPYAPYVTELAYIDQYDTRYVVHGDDITSDADGNDCYRFVKQAGRFLVVKRTPGISTTDLVGRMLAEPAPSQNGTTSSELYPYHVHSIQAVLNGTESCASGSGPELKERIRAYATDETGLAPGVPVWDWSEKGWTSLVQGPLPRPGQRIVYVDGGWDLFCSGHIAFLQAVAEAEDERGRQRGWFSDEKKAERIQSQGTDYPPAYVIAGVHTDTEVHAAKGGAYPIMSIFERGLCILQCRNISALLFSAPRKLSADFLSKLPISSSVHDMTSSRPDIVYHGPTTNNEVPSAYSEADQMGLFAQIEKHKWQDVHAETIVARILKSRSRYEERQRIKGVKAVGEEEIRGHEIRLDAAS